MGEALFNEAEALLLGRWQTARELELTMGKMRESYTALCKRVLEAVQAKHSDLDASRLWVTQFWGDGYMCMAKKSWVTKDTTGFWIDNLLLEYLTDVGQPPPTASVWFDRKSFAPEELTIMKNTVRSSARGILRADEAKLWSLADSDDVGMAVHFIVPEKKTELTAMLAEGDGHRFVDCMVAHFDSLVRFTPSVDQALQKVRRKP